MDAAIPGLHARHAHEELQDTPILDKGFYLLFGNNHFVMKHLRNQDQNSLDAYCAWLLESAKGYTIKIVNPGGVEDWKQISRKSIKELDSPRTKLRSHSTRDCTRPGWCSRSTKATSFSAYPLQ